MRPHPSTSLVSVVLPARDEAGNIAALLSGIALVLSDRPHEIVVVDDASTDDTRQVLAALQPGLPQVRVLCHDRSCGQSAAVRTGVLAARGALIATLDADGQNPPENLTALLAPFETGDPVSGVRLGLVQGQRMDRRDRWTRQAASVVANRIRAGLLRDGVRDSGCGLKAFPREVYLALPFFDHIHRFMPAMVAREGWRVVTVPVSHAPRAFGRSKYGNWGRAAAGIVDLMGAAWLIRRRRLPRVHEAARAAATDMQGAA